MILAIIIFILILGFLIFIHEFGHFILAKKLGVKVEEFGVGYPPAIWKKKVGETVYSINLLPLGGFTRLLGEEGEEKINDPRSFISKTPWKKAAIIAGGVAMNFLLATIIFYFILGFGNFQARIPLIYDYHFPLGNQNNFPMIVGVLQDSPAQEAGLGMEDLIIKGNGVELNNSDQLVDFIAQNKEKEVILAVKKAGERETKEIKITPEPDPSQEKGVIGIAIRDVAEVSYNSFFQKSTSGFLHSLNLSHYTFLGLGYYIKASVVEREVEHLSSSVVGPVGILAITKLSVQEGLYQVVFLLALISLALAMMNILPVPPLDGGRLIFIAFEAVTKKRVPEKIERRLQEIGIAFFIILFILVTYKDIIQFKDILW